MYYSSQHPLGYTEKCCLYIIKDTRIELSATGKEKSWMAKEQLEAVHAAGVAKSGLLLRESQSQSPMLPRG